MKIFETEELYLRLVEEKDAQDIFEYAQDAETGPKAGWPPHKSVDETLGLIKFWLSADCKEEQYVIVLKSENKVVGTMGVVNLNKKIKDEKNIAVKNFISEGKNVYEIGVTISKNYWGKGICTKTLKEMIKYLFEIRHADVVVATHYQQNIASEKVQMKNNLKQIYKYERDSAWWTTSCKTMIVRAISKNEWLKGENSEALDRNR